MASSSIAGRVSVSARGTGRLGGFTPFKPPKRPPPGWYDPTIDAQERAAQRGYTDFQQDTARNTERADSNYALAQGRINQGQARTLADIVTARQAEQRNYDRLASSQLQGGNAAGVLGGGFLEAAAAKRAANQQIETQALDTTQARSVEDTGQRLSDLGLNYTREGQDAQTALQRAGRENTFFGTDANAQRAYEAAQAGYTPPERPKNEHSTAGVVYRDTGHKTNLLAGGQVVSDRALARIIKRHRAALAAKS